MLRNKNMRRSIPKIQTKINKVMSKFKLNKIFVTLNKQLTKVIQLKTFQIASLRIKIMKNKFFKMKIIT